MLPQRVVQRWSARCRSICSMVVPGARNVVRELEDVRVAAACVCEVVCFEGTSLSARVYLSSWRPVLFSEASVCQSRHSSRSSKMLSE